MALASSIFLVVMQELIQENFGRGKRGRARTRIEMLIDPFFILIMSKEIFGSCATKKIILCFHDLKNTAFFMSTFSIFGAFHIFLNIFF